MQWYALGAIQVLCKPPRGRVGVSQNLTLAYKEEGEESGSQAEGCMLTLHGGERVMSTNIKKDLSIILIPISLIMCKI